MLEARGLLKTKGRFITVIVLVILGIAVLTTIIPEKTEIQRVFDRVSLPGIGSNTFTFLVSVLANIFTALLGVLVTRSYLSNRWSEKHVGASSSITNSEYDYYNILKMKDIRELIIADQNVHMLTQDAEAIRRNYRKMIFRLLREGTDVYLIMCNQNTTGIQLWQTVTGPQYSEHLYKSTRIVLQWKRNYESLDKRYRKGKFTVITTPLITLNFIVINLQNNDRKMVMIPYLYTPEYRSRPVFVIDSKINRSIYERYESVIYQILGKGYVGMREMQ